MTALARRARLVFLNFSTVWAALRAVADVALLVYVIAHLF